VQTLVSIERELFRAVVLRLLIGAAVFVALPDLISLAAAAFR